MNTQYVPLEEVMNILKNWEGITYNCDTIEDSFDMLADLVLTIQTIDISVIDEMIEERQDRIDDYTGDEGNLEWESELLYGQQSILQELKSRLSHKN